MVTLVHITPEKNAARIRRGGLRPTGSAWLNPSQRVAPEVRALFEGPGTYAFPRLDSFALTFQWVREIARFHIRQPLVAVTIRLPDDELVGVGHYGRGHEARTAAEATGLLRATADPRGWEVFIPRRVGPAEIRSIRPAPRNTGWRYFPDAHGHTPHTCSGCLTRGTYGVARLARRRPDEYDGPFPPSREILSRIAGAVADDDIPALRAGLDLFARDGRRTSGPIAELAPLADHPSAAVRVGLVEAIGAWRTPGVAEILAAPATDVDADVREAVGYFVV